MYLVYSYLCRAFHSHHFIPASQQLCREGICMVSKFQEKKKLRPRDTKRLVPITEMANSQVNPKAHTHPCLVGDKQNPSGLGTSPPSWNNECAPPPQHKHSLPIKHRFWKQIHTTKCRRHVYLLQYTSPQRHPKQQISLLVTSSHAFSSEIRL